MPTELRKEEAALGREVELEDDNTAVPRSHVDDEYGRAAERDPRILVTTSRDPSSRLVQFAKELKLVFPNAVRVNRGGTVISDLVDSCRTSDYTDIVVVHEHRGEPDGLVVCHLPYGPTAYFGLFNAVLRHDIGDKAAVGTVSQAYPHLILDAFTSPLGQRVAGILRHLFPVPKPDARRVITWANTADYISFRHHVYAQPGGPATLELRECGPRFEAKLYQISLGTMDQPHADKEWALRSYTRSAKKQKLAAVEDGDHGAQR